jgi:hypothetical protein
MIHSEELSAQELLNGLDVFAFDTKGKYWSLSIPMTRRDEYIGHSMNSKLAELKAALSRPDPRVQALIDYARKYLNYHGHDLHCQLKAACDAFEKDEK